MNKNKVSDMAKDFGLTSKDILSVLSTYEDGSKKPSQVLSADEVNLDLRASDAEASGEDRVDLRRVRSPEKARAQGCPRPRAEPAEGE